MDVVRGSDPAKYDQDRHACERELKAKPTDVGPDAATVGLRTGVGAAAGAAAGAIIGAIGRNVSGNTGAGAAAGAAVGLIEGVVDVVTAHHKQRRDALMRCMEAKGYTVAPWCQAHPESWRCH